MAKKETKANFYRVKLFTVSQHKEDRKYCFDNNLIGVGYGSDDCSDVDSYINKIEYEIQYKDSSFYSSYKNLYKMKNGDYVWTQIDGLNYALGKIESDFFIDDTHKSMGAVKKCKWKKDISFDEIPGKIINYFVGGGRTLVKMTSLSESIKMYCKFLYKENVSLENLKFEELIHYDDLEDLVGLYLQEKEKYFILPSTNKKSKKLVEFELVNSINNNKACIQCKTGDEQVFINTIEQIKNEFKNYTIYICTTNDKNYNDIKEFVKTITIQELYDWAKNHINILPKRIQNYIKLCNR